MFAKNEFDFVIRNNSSIDIFDYRFQDETWNKVSSPSFSLSLFFWGLERLTRLWDTSKGGMIDCPTNAISWNNL